MDLVQVSSINTSRGGSGARISGRSGDARWQYSRKISMTWKEKKNERICRGGTRLPVHDGRGPFWALQQDEAALRAPAGRYTQRGRAGGQSLRRDDGASSRTDDEFG